jgi:hypothetical protein
MVVLTCAIFLVTYGLIATDGWTASQRPLAASPPWR